MSIRLVSSRAVKLVTAVAFFAVRRADSGRIVGLRPSARQPTAQTDSRRRAAELRNTELVGELKKVVRVTIAVAPITRRCCGIRAGVLWGWDPAALWAQ